MRKVVEFWKKYSQDLFAAFVLAVTVTVFYPVGVYQNNVGIVNFSLYNVISLLISVALVAFIVLAGLAVFIHKFLFNFVGVIYASIILCFWVQGNLLGYDLGNLDGHVINWREFNNFYLVEVLLWAGVIAVAIWFRKFLHRNLNTLLVVLLLFEFIPLVITGFQQSFDQKASPGLYFSNEDKFEFSSDKNVVIIILDTVRADTFEQIIERTPAYQSTFRDFTYFSNMVAGYPTTKPSIPLLLSGEYYDNSTPYKEYMADTQSRSLPALLKANGYAVEHYSFGPLAYLSIWDNVSTTPSKDELLKSTEKLYLVTFLRYLPLPFKPFMVDQYYKGREYWGRDMVDFYNNVSKVSKEDKGPVFKFIHLTGAHGPFQLDSTLQFSPDSSYLDQFEGALWAIDKLLQEMKAADVYDNSLIFVTGDHGSPYPWDVQDELRRSATTLMLNGTPPLLVKGFNEVNDKLKTSDAPVSLMDIPISVMDALELDNKLPGVSVFGDIPRNRSRIFYFYEWQNADWSSDFLPPSYKFEIIGDVRDRQSWHFSREELVDAGQINLWPLHYKYGENIISESNPYMELYSIGFAGDEVKGAWATGPYSCLHLPVESSKGSLALSLSVSPFLQREYLPQQTFNILVDNSLLKTIQLQNEDNVSMTIPLPANLQNNDELNLCIEFPDAKYSPKDLKIDMNTMYLGGFFKSIVINDSAGYTLPVKFDFSETGNGSAIMQDGWSFSEPEYTWTVGKNAQLILPLITDGSKDLNLTISAIPFIHGEELNQQVVIVRSGGDELTQWTMDQPGEYVVNIPSEYNKNGLVSIDFEIPNATSPISVGFNQDERVLGIAVQWIQVDQQ
jgi:hypothetical protein